MGYVHASIAGHHRCVYVAVLRIHRFIDYLDLFVVEYWFDLLPVTVLILAFWIRPGAAVAYHADRRTHRLIIDLAGYVYNLLNLDFERW